jgi:hypothetical protein
MPLLIRKFSNLDAANILLRGGIIGGRDIVSAASRGGATLTGSSPQASAQSALYLHGLTLIFTTPNETVTFASSPTNAQVPITLATAIAQIHAQTTGIKAQLIDGRMAFVDEDASAIVALSDAGTANAIFGYGNTAVSGVLYGAPGEAAPALVSASAVANSNTYLVVTDEA